MQDRPVLKLLNGRRGQGVARLRNERDGLRHVSANVITDMMNKPARPIRRVRAFPGKLLAFEPTAGGRENFARNLRPNMNRSAFTPATRDQGYRAAEVPAQKVEIDRGRFDINVSLDQGLSAINLSVKQPENLTANVGVDRTRAFRNVTGNKTGMRGRG